MTTRRMSGMLAAAGPAGPALLESLDAFKRKHTSQNKEIIHKNSGLMRSNSDLSARLAALQEELMAAKAENLELAAVNCQLTAKLETLRAQLRDAHEEIRKNQFTTPQLPPGHADTFKATLDAVVGQLQNMQALYSTLAHTESSPRSYPPVSLPDSPESQLAQSTSASPIPSTSNETSQSSSSGIANRPRSSTAIVSAPPDLSLISEGSQEPSLSSSQAGYIPYDDYYGMDEEELQENYEMPSDSHRRSHRTPSPEIEVVRSLSLSPTPSPPPMPPIASSVSETAARQSRRRNSGVLPPPPRDLTQRKTQRSKAEGQSVERLEAPTSPPNRPSLLADLGISPGSLSLSGIDDLAIRRIRENSPTLVLQEATPPGPQERPSSYGADLTRTIRASTSMESIDKQSALSGLLAPISASQHSSGQRSKNTVPKPAVTAESTSKTQRKTPLVGAMQGRPSATSLVSLNGHTKPEEESLKESKDADASSSTSEKPKPKVRRSASVIHRRLSSKLSEPGAMSPPVVSSSAAPSARAGSVLETGDQSTRARSTTPEMEPPSITSILQDISPASLQQPVGTSENPKPTKARPVKEKAAGPTVVKRRVSRENVTGDSAEQPRSRSKSLIREGSAEATEKTPENSQPQQTASETSVTSLSESQENSASAAAVTGVTGTREGRRARNAVNYQEPSLSKKMRAPAGYVPSIKTVASTRGQHAPAPTVASGVRRKSSLEAMNGKALGSRRQDNLENKDGSDDSDD